MKAKLARLSLLLMALACVSNLARGADGFAAGVTGGAGGLAVTATTAGQLITYGTSTVPYVITVSGTIPITGGNGTSGGSVRVRSNKTIQGADSGATIIGTLDLGSGGVSNVIIQNLNITNPNSIGTGDGVTIFSATNVFVTKCTFYDCGDGSLDITRASDFITVSWCKFFYTFNSGHNFVNLIASSETDAGDYRITFHHNWWAQGCQQRMPMSRFGTVHMYNNYFGASGNGYCSNARNSAEFLSERNHYDGVRSPIYIEPGTDGRIKINGNLYTSCTGSIDDGNDTVFTPPYAYTLDLAADVKAIVTGSAGTGFTIPVPSNPTNLTWTGAVSGVWDTSAANFSSSGTAAAFTQGDLVAFNSTGTNRSMTLSGLLRPGSWAVSGTQNYTFSGTGFVTGTTKLIKSGSGTLTLNQSNSYSGGTTVGALGKLVLNDDNAAGPGAITLSMATLVLGSSGAGFDNAIIIDQLGHLELGTSAGIFVNSEDHTLSSFNGNASAVVFRPAGGVLTLAGPMPGFVGTALIESNSGTVQFNNSNNYNLGSSNATFDLGAGAGVLCNRNGDITINLGALSGSSATILSGRSNGSGATATTYVIGAYNKTTTFAGRIQNGGDSLGVHIVKTGTGTLTLSGTCTYTGTTSINAGKLLVTGSIPTASVLVQNNAALELAGGRLGGMVSVGGGASVVTSGSSFIGGAITNSGTVNVTNGVLRFGSSFVNNGTMRLTGSGAVVGAGQFTNNGLLDLMTGAQTLPPNFTNNGMVLDSRAVRVQGLALSGSGATVSIQSYAGHSYQMQRSISLTLPLWQIVAQAGGATMLTGDGSVLVFRDAAAATGTNYFYRIVVSP